VRFELAPCPTDASSGLQRALGVSQVLADTLVRRGFADPAAATAFLALHGSQHDPLALGEMAAGCAAIEAARADGRRIVVHGDYDVDGVCATALLVTVLRDLGADAEPFLPSRFAEGYGLAVETVERLHTEGTGLLVTVDCGISAVEAVRRAGELGLEIVVSDHHQPAAELPACPLVAPSGRGAPYPAELCGTGVAYKLAEALVARAGADPDIALRHLDLVALATVADLVPLQGENRGLVRAGMDALRRTRRAGLLALMRVAAVDRTRAGSSEIGFRLAPRINAAGRLGHPDQAFELLTTGDPERARALAERLDALNRERQAVEAEILRQALDVVAGLPAARRAARGLVLASAEWHPGVIGIVASRLVERLRRPVVLIAVDGDEGRGSGRSIPAFDLHAALATCGEHLLAHGGHRAAAGLTVRADAIDAFAAAFEAHADELLDDSDLVPRERIDAVVSLADVSLELADELERLEPHGLGNPAPRLLLPAVAVEGAGTLGADGRHLRFTARSSAGTCRTVWWGAGGDAERLRAGGRFDLACRVERNDWNGTSAVQLVARAVEPVRPAPAAGLCATPCDATCPARALPVEQESAARARLAPVGAAAVHDRRDRGALAELARLAACGESVLVLCADVSRRRALVAGPLAPERYGLRGAILASARCAPRALDVRFAALEEPGPWLVVADHATLAARPELAERVRHVAVLDAPLDAAAEAAVAALPAGVDVHLVGGAAEHEAAAKALAGRAPRAVCTAVWRALEDGPATREALGDRLAALTHGPWPQDAARALAALVAAGHVAEGADGFMRARAADGSRLEDVPDYAAWLGEHEDALARLRRPAAPLAAVR
jgi:single-stranded-DNA-specific exonuclease